MPRAPHLFKGNQIRSLLSLLFLILTLGSASAQPSPTGPPYQFICNAAYASSFTVQVSYVTVVPGVSAKGIYICGWHATTTNVVSQTTFQLFQGKSLTDTTSSILTPPIATNYTAPSTDHIDFAILATSLFTATQSPETLYLNVGAATGQGNNLGILIYYGQY